MINPFRRAYTEEDLKLFSFLGQTRYFEGLSNEELAHFIPFMYLRNYKLNEVVFFRDDPSHALYIVKKGSVGLTFDIKEEFITLKTVNVGRIFGDNSLLEKTTRIYTAVVTSEVTDLYVIPQVNFLQIFNENPGIRAKVMTNFARLYNEYTVKLFNSYRSSFGFFDLKMVYADKAEQEDTGIT